MDPAHCSISMVEVSDITFEFVRVDSGQSLLGVSTKNEMIISVDVHGGSRRVIRPSSSIRRIRHVPLGVSECAYRMEDVVIHSYLVFHRSYVRE